MGKKKKKETKKPIEWKDLTINALIDLIVGIILIIIDKLIGLIPYSVNTAVGESPPST